MNTNMKELNINEMEQVNGGNPVLLICAAALVIAAAPKVVDYVYDRFTK